IAVENQQFTDEDMELWDSLEKRKVWPKFPESTNLMAQFQLTMFIALEKAELHHLELTVLSWTADDFAFREYAFCILCLASGGDNLTLIDQRRILGLKAPNGLSAANFQVEVRLFEWRREDGERLDSLMDEPRIGQLIESKPGTKYSIMERDDRMEIEKVIQGAVEKLVNVENENDT
ncbi:MAG: hypothetical protein Q9180_006725, partial [Flavoplaca navasiana]